MSIKPHQTTKAHQANVGRQVLNMLDDLAHAKPKLSESDWQELVGHQVIDIVETANVR